MSKIVLTKVEQTLRLSGELIRQTVPLIPNNESRQLLKENNANIDLAEVTKVDTAGLAWLLTQVEYAQANDCHLSLLHIPSNLIKLAELSSVLSFLPINTNS